MLEIPKTGGSDLGSYMGQIGDKPQSINLTRSISERISHESHTLLDIYHSSSEQMHLQSEVKVQWNEGFDLGQGIDAVTGARKASALQPFTIPAERIGEDHKRQSGCRVLSSFDEIFKGEHEGFGATVNVGLPEKLGMSVEWSTVSGFSARSSITEYYIKGSFGFEQPPENSLKFTSDAYVLLHDPKKFRECYGDYFICGYQRQYRFHAIVSYQYEEKSENSAIEASVRLDSFAYGGLSGTFRRNRGKNNSRTVENFLYITSGFSPSVTKNIDVIKTVVTEDAILQLLENIQTMDCRGVKQVALLRHYSTLCPTKLTNSIDGLSGNLQIVFSELHQMDHCCLKLDFNLHHPAVLSDVIIKAYRIATLFRRKRATLVHDGISRRKIMKDLIAIEGQVESMIEQSTYILSELRNRLHPPKQPVESYQANAAWQFGIGGCKKIDTNHPIDKNIRRVEIHGKLLGWEVLLKYTEPGDFLRGFSWKRMSQRRIAFTSANISPDNTRELESYSSVTNKQNFYRAPHKDHPVTVLGFTVTFNNREGKKVRFEIIQGGLLHNQLKIHITDIPRGCECHCRVTYLELNASAYGFIPEH